MAKKKPETTEETSTAVAVRGPSAAMITLFAGSADMAGKLNKLERRNLPPMFKPGDVPIGGLVSGKIVKFVNSPVSTIKGKLIWLEHETGKEFTFPCTGVIRSALAPGVTANGDALDKALEKEVGKMFYALRLDDSVSFKYDKAGKKMFVFDVRTSKE